MTLPSPGEPNRFGQRTALDAVGARLTSYLQYLNRLYAPQTIGDEFWAAPSAICRSELAFLGLGYPRFSHRCGVRSGKAEGFCSFRRLAHYQPQVSSLPIATEVDGQPQILDPTDKEYELIRDHCMDLVSESNPLVESVLPAPDRFAGKFFVVQHDFRRVFGTTPDCYGSVYASMLEFGGGVCSQAVIFMALLHLERYVKRIMTPAEISRLNFRELLDDGGTKTAIRGFFIDDFERCFSSAEIGLACHKLISRVIAPAREGGEEPSPATFRIENVIPYLKSGLPAIWMLDVEPYVRIVQGKDTYSGFAHALLVCGVSETEPSSFLVHDPSRGPFVEISVKQLEEMGRMKGYDPDHGAFIPTLVPCPAGICLHYAGVAKTTLLHLLENRELCTRAKPIAEDFPTLGARVDEGRILAPREVILVDRQSEFEQTIGNAFPSLKIESVRFLVSELRKLTDDSRFLWLNISPIGLDQYQALAWAADRDCDPSLGVYGNLLLVAMLSETPAVEVTANRGLAPASSASPQAPGEDVMQEPMPDAVAAPSRLGLSLITSFSARALSTTLMRFWPNSEVPPEVYCFMLSDAGFVAQKLGVNQDADVGLYPETVAHLISKEVDSEERLSQIAAGIKECLDAQNLPSPIGIASYIPQLSASNVNEARLVPKKFFKAIAKIALILKRDYHCSSLSFVEFVGGSTTSHISLGRRGDASREGGRRIDQEFYLVNWECPLGDGHTRLARCLSYVVDDDIARQFREHGITLAAEIEPGDFNLLSSLESVGSFFEVIEDQDPDLAGVVSLNLDIGHVAILRNLTSRPREFDQQLEALMPRVSHAHISDHYLKCHFSDSAFFAGVPAYYTTLLQQYAAGTEARLANNLPCSRHVSIEIEAADSIEQVRQALQTVESVLVTI